MQMWLQKILKALVSILKSVLAKETDSTFLKQWAGQTKSSADRLADIMQAVHFMSPLLAATPLRSHVYRAYDTLSCLTRMPEVFNGCEGMSVEVVQSFGLALQKSVFGPSWVAVETEEWEQCPQRASGKTDVVSNLRKVKDDWNELVGQVALFEESPLLGQDGIMSDMRKSLEKSSGTVLQPVVTCLKAVVGVGELSTLNDAKLEEISGWTLPGALCKDAEKWAHESGDKLLGIQLQGLHMLGQAHL